MNTPCVRCGTIHTKEEPCRCPNCGSENIEESGKGFSGDIRHGNGMMGVDISEIECKDCGISWWW